MELGCSKSAHDSVKDAELSSSQRTNHDATGNETDGAELNESHLTGDFEKAGDHWTITASSLLVNLRKKGISRVGDDCRGNTSNDTRKQGNTKAGGLADFTRVFAHANEDGIGNATLDDELGAGVRNLLKENGNKTGVESHKTFRLGHLGKTIAQTSRPCRVRYGTDTDSLQRTQENIGDELCTSGSTEVNAGLVIPSLLFSQVLRSLNFEIFDSTKLEPSLNEVARKASSELLFVASIT
jgi:hypothetical protein